MGDLNDGSVIAEGARPGGRSERVRRAVTEATIQQLLENGYEQLTIPDIARAAGVNPTTIYRRWKSKGILVLDAVALASSGTVPAPDTGSLRGDLRELIGGVAIALRNDQVRSVARSLIGLPESEASEARNLYWNTRKAIAGQMIDQAIARGELEPGVDAWDIVEIAASRIWMRAVITETPFDEDFVDRVVDEAVELSKAKPPSKS
ncbi:MAG: TetR/AcrR family transcriptional regulator [Solirubrobacterales bacterium]